jgi:hypothetical protein
MLPSAVVSDRRLQSCRSAQVVALGPPHLNLKARVTRGSIHVVVELLSVRPTSSDPADFRPLHAFVSVDRHARLLRVEAGGQSSLTFAGLPSGVHTIRYGTFVFDGLLDGHTACVRIP